MRIKLYILFFLISIFGYSQSDHFKLPEIGLPSPQAFEITKYGDTPVDESSGRISPSIPIYNYSAGQLSVPIYMTYNGGGVKVSQNPTWTGVSWNINSGGVISRIVKDLPDETPLGRYFHSKDELDGLKEYYETWSNNSDPDDVYLVESGYKLPQEIVDQFRNFENNDTQVDEFNFNFGNFSGSFYLLEENNVWIAKQKKHDSELKIEILGNFNLNSDYEFKITTPDGVMYFFGGLAGDIGGTLPPAFAYEETQMRDKSVTPMKTGIRSKSAFYLTRIENVYGDKILFEYETIPEYEILSSREQKLFNFITGDPCHTEVSDGLINNVNFINRPIKNTVFNGKFLKRIWSPYNSNSIIFNSVDVYENLSGGAQNLKYKVLNSINLENRILEFTYFPNVSNLMGGLKDKFFLTDLKFKNNTSQLEAEKYKFEYKDLTNIPGNFSNSQDYLGYYNGISNPSLLPRNASKYLLPYLSETISFPNSNQFDNLLNLSDFSSYDGYLANREPSFNHATNGILTKITYPTGGVTEFEYEPVEKKTISDIISLSIHSNMGQPNSNYVQNSKLTHLGGISSSFIDEDGNPSQNVFVTQDVKVNLDINTLLSTGLDYHDYVYVEFKDLTLNSTVEKKYFFPTSVMITNNNQTNFKTSFLFSLIKGNGYEIRIGFGDNYAGRINDTNLVDFSNTGMVANVTFEYIKGYDQNDGLGIRIKRTKDFTTINSNPQIKRYYYTKIKEASHIYDENSVTVYSPLFINYYTTSVTCPAYLDYTNLNDHPDILNRYYITLNSNSFNQNLPSSDVTSMYENVSISYGGDNFENGGIEKKFYIKKDKNQIHYSPNPGVYTSPYIYLLIKFYELDMSNITNEASCNGLLLQENVWKKNQNNVLYKTNKKINKYTFIKNDGITSANIIKIGECNYCTNFAIPNLYIGLYETYSYKSLLSSNEEISFIEEIPLSRYIPPVITQGWQLNDDDGDGIINLDDEDSYNFTEEHIESKYKSISSKTNYEYHTSVLPSLPSKVSNINSLGEYTETRNYYPILEDITSLSGELNFAEISAYNILKDQNNISSPFQTETYNGSELLSKIRKNYGHDSFSGNYLYKIKASKGGGDLEDRIIYSGYDLKGNPNELSLADGTKISYIWSYDKKPIYKFVNATINDVNLNLNSGTFIDPDDYNPGNPIPSINTNPFITLLPQAQVTIYNYHPITRQITSIVDPKGDIITYEYDEFNRLKFVKDKDGNILSENEYHYRTQN